MNTTTVKNNSASKKLDIKKMSVMAMFIALGYICLFVFRFKVSFLTLDFKDVFITLGGFVYGPIAAVVIAFTEALLELVTVSDTGFWGALMNFGGSAAFAVTASVVYKYNKSFKGAVIGLVSAIFSMTAIMLLLNLVITPIYAHTDVKTVVGMILPLLLPFNLIKSLLNAALTFILYKPMSQSFKSIGLIPKGGNEFKIAKKSVIGLVIALAIIIASIVVVFAVFNGNFQIVKS